MNKLTVWKAYDGTIFENEQEALSYEIKSYLAESDLKFYDEDLIEISGEELLNVSFYDVWFIETTSTNDLEILWKIS